jgi:hypothetical protein
MSYDATPAGGEPPAEPVTDSGKTRPVSRVGSGQTVLVGGVVSIDQVGVRLGQACERWQTYAASKLRKGGADTAHRAEFDGWVVALTEAAPCAGRTPRALRSRPSGALGPTFFQRPDIGLELGSGDGAPSYIICRSRLRPATFLALSRVIAFFSPRTRATSHSSGRQRRGYRQPATAPRPTPGSRRRTSVTWRSTRY